MSANLIGFGCHLQQKLDEMDAKSRRARWAGDAGEKLYQIARQLHTLSDRVRCGRSTPADNRTEKRLMGQARNAVRQLGDGIEVHRQPDPCGWPFVVVFPGDVPPGSSAETYLEQGIAVPPRA